ncbi:MAG TPA: glycosyltransferase, partial [Acetobacteraceae bacterium]|nr:glycosyltransferase [Acetobacteraceae bacterium]
MASARSWLERAHRLAPKDGTVAFTLAMLLLRLGDPAAIPLFESFAQTHDRREAWLGLAAARRHARQADAAAAAAAAALARHVPDPSFAPLLDGLASAAGLPGWCGVTGDGLLLLGGGAAIEAVSLALDGRPVAALAGDEGATLPRGWAKARRLEVSIGGKALLGSPIAVPAIRRIEGFVAVGDGGIEGWAWHPGDPDRDPKLTLLGPDGQRRVVVARDFDVPVPEEAPLARPRGFRLRAGALGAFLDAPLRVVGHDGRDLLGSPLDPGAERRSAGALARAVPGGTSDLPAALFAPVWAGVSGPPAPAPRERAGIDVIVPVHRDAATTRACLDSLATTVGEEVRVIVVDDASPDPELVRALDQRARAGRIRLIRLPENRGFPAAANAGLRAAAGRDAVLLNSDTLLAPGWLEGLRAAAYSAPDIGTATPLSNDATILSYPAIDGGNPVPDLAATRRLARLAASANAGQVVEIPTGVGFCLYLRHDCLERVGLFREDLFA